MRTIETKGQFAKRKRRSPACISGWIKEGKISASALIGEGSRAQIWVEQADADLAAALVPAQQWGQEFPANERSSFFAPDQATSAAPVSALELDRARRAKADADKAEQDAEMGRRKLLIDNGRFVLAEHAQTEMAKGFGRVVALFDGALPEVSSAIGSRFAVPQRDVLHVLREEFRKVRARAAAAARKEAKSMPATIEVDTRELLAEEQTSNITLLQ